MWNRCRVRCYHSWLRPSRPVIQCIMFRAVAYPTGKVNSWSHRVNAAPLVFRSYVQKGIKCYFILKFAVLPSARSADHSALGHQIQFMIAKAVGTKAALYETAAAIRAKPAAPGVDRERRWAKMRTSFEVRCRKRSGGDADSDGETGRQAPDRCNRHPSCFWFERRQSRCTVPIFFPSSLFSGRNQSDRMVRVAWPEVGRHTGPPPSLSPVSLQDRPWRTRAI